MTASRAGAHGHSLMCSVDGSSLSTMLDSLFYLSNDMLNYSPKCICRHSPNMLNSYNMPVMGLQEHSIAQWAKDTILIEPIF